MATLADAIEAYLKQLIGSQAGYVEVRRCDLADSFACAPSQINYVLETRFSTNHGYIVESRRGGGGYIRIRRVIIQPRSTIYSAVCEAVGDRIDANGMLRLLGRLVDNEVITRSRAEQIARSSTAETLSFAEPFSDYVRACMLKGMMLILLNDPENDEGGGGNS